MTSFETEPNFRRDDIDKNKSKESKQDHQDRADAFGRQCKTDKSQKQQQQVDIQIEDELRSGTGFMQSLCDAIRSFELRGYRDNLICCFDHLKSQCRRITILPSEIDVKDIYRFENTSDPADQSILYAISIPSKNLKGLYIESYGLYHDDQSDALRNALRLFR